MLSSPDDSATQPLREGDEKHRSEKSGMIADNSQLVTLEGWTRESCKIGGANNDDKNISGKYTRPIDEKDEKQGNEVVWIKQANKTVRNISEIGTYLLKKAMFPESEYFAKSEFCLPTGAKESGPNGENVFIKSDDVGGKSLWEHVIHIVKTAHCEDKELKAEVIKLPLKRQRGLGSINKYPFRKALIFAQDHCKYQGISEILFAALLSGDLDLHFENIIVIERKQSDRTIKYILRNIDHDAGLYKLTELNDPHDPMIKRVAKGMPTNHINEFPTAWRVTDAFADTIQLGSINLSYGNTLSLWADQYIDAIKKYYNKYNTLEGLFFKLAAWHGLKLQLDPKADLKSIISIFKKELVEAMQKRIEFYHKYEFEIQLSNCITEENGRYILKKGANGNPILDRLINDPEYQKYFIAGDYHFRGKTELSDDYQKDFKVALSSIINKRVREIGIEQNFSFYRRVRSAFHDTFNHHNFDRSDKAAFFGRPTKSNRLVANKFTYIETPFKFAKNLIKLGAEFVPYIFEEGFNYLADRLNKFIQNDKTIENPLQKSYSITIGLANAAYYASKGLHYLFKGIRLLARTVTSPVRSFKEGWKRHPVLGIASAIVSVVASVTIATLLAPIVAPILAVKGALALTSALSHIGSVLAIPAAATTFTAYVLGIPVKTALNNVWYKFKKWWYAGKEPSLEKAHSRTSPSSEAKWITPSRSSSSSSSSTPPSASPLLPERPGGSYGDIKDQLQRFGGLNPNSRDTPAIQEQTAAREATLTDSKADKGLAAVASKIGFTATRAQNSGEVKDQKKPAASGPLKECKV